MNKLILLVSSFLVFVLAAGLTPQQALKNFDKAMTKYKQKGNPDIIDKHFYADFVASGKRLTREQFVALFLEKQPNKPKIQVVKANPTLSFVKDGLLNISYIDKKGSLHGTVLAKPYTDIEGGFRLYKFTDFFTKL